jgi:uncharacterized protein YcbK (DUF882 family)
MPQVAAARPNPCCVRRRAVLRLGLCTLAGGAAPGAARAALRRPEPEAAAAVLARPRVLWVTRPQAQETVRAVYWANGQLQAQGYAALTHIYRDVQANREHPVALALLDLNFALQSAVHALYGPRPLVLFSGYRTAATNARVGGVEPSIHASAQADDYIYEGLSLADNFRLARYFQVGGLGLYPERGSLHKDVGARRSWITRGR